MCIYFDKCIEKAMYYAKQNNFEKAIDVFIEETSCYKCTQYISEELTCRTILSHHRNDANRFKYNIGYFYTYLTCKCIKIK